MYHPQENNYSGDRLEVEIEKVRIQTTDNISLLGWFHKKDLKKLNRLKIQLDRLNAIGGLDAIVPSEGIVFKYKGKTYKFTGAFAPINQITGLMTF